jgi:hypothetical protein
MVGKSFKNPMEEVTKTGDAKEVGGSTRATIKKLGQLNTLFGQKN